MHSTSGTILALSAIRVPKLIFEVKLDNVLMFSGLVFRMTAPLLVVSLLLLLLGAFTAWWVHSMQQQAMDLNSQSIATSNMSHTIENQLVELQTIPDHRT